MIGRVFWYHPVIKAFYFYGFAKDNDVYIKVM